MSPSATRYSGLPACKVAGIADSKPSANAARRAYDGAPLQRSDSAMSCWPSTMSCCCSDFFSACVTSAATTVSGSANASGTTCRFLRGSSAPGSETKVVLPLNCTLYSEAPSTVARRHSPAGSSGHGKA